MIYWSTLTLNDWARYVSKINRQDLTRSLQLLVECILNRLTSLYSKIHYKEKNYLTVRTAVFKYITPPIVKVEYVITLVYLVYYIPNIPMFLYSELLVIYCLYDLATPYFMALLVLYCQSTYLG